MMRDISHLKYLIYIILRYISLGGQHFEPPNMSPGCGHNAEEAMNEEVKKLEIESWSTNQRMLSLEDGEATLQSIENLFMSTKRSFLCSFQRFSDADSAMAKAISEKKEVFGAVSKYPEVSRWLSCCLNM